MHYRNGREAKTGDPVITMQNGKAIAGTIYQLNESSTACNAMVAYPIPGGASHAYVTVGECFHAEDAMYLMELREGQKDIATGKSEPFVEALPEVRMPAADANATANQ